MRAVRCIAAQESGKKLRRNSRFLWHTSKSERGQRPDHYPLRNRERRLDVIMFFAATASVVKLHESTAPNAAYVSPRDRRLPLRRAKACL